MPRDGRGFLLTPAQGGSGGFRFGGKCFGTVEDIFTSRYIFSLFPENIFWMHGRIRKSKTCGAVAAKKMAAPTKVFAIVYSEIVSYFSKLLSASTSFAVLRQIIKLLSYVAKFLTNVEIL